MKTKTASTYTALSLALLMAYACPAVLRADENDTDQATARSDRTDAHQLGTTLSTNSLIQKAVEAQRAGFEFLVKSQNPDGTWGSHDPKTAQLMNFGFGTASKGSNDGVRLACTAICAHALMEYSDRTKAQQAALDRAREALLESSKFAYHMRENFNIWGYCYKLDFLTRWMARGDSTPFRDRIRQAAAVCIEGLEKYQQHDGGWSYYASPMRDGDSMSFTTANILMALHRAKSLGMAVKDGLINDAAGILERMRVPDGSFVYSASHRNRPSSMLKKLGAGSRTVVIAAALHDMGRFDREDILTSLSVFQEGENYLEDGRKLIQPHTAAHQISGYFFFYGYNYATEIASLLGDEYPEDRWNRLAWTMIRTQEDNGAWWDTPMADYGDKYATGFALLSLQRYLDSMAKRGHKW